MSQSMRNRRRDFCTAESLWFVLIEAHP